MLQIKFLMECDHRTEIWTSSSYREIAISVDLTKAQAKPPTRPKSDRVCGAHNFHITLYTVRRRYNIYDYEIHNTTSKCYSVPFVCPFVGPTDPGGEAACYNNAYIAEAISRLYKTARNI